MVIEPEENKAYNSDVPYIVHEGEVARLERIIKRMWLAVLALIVGIVATNFVWIWYINQYDFESYEVYTDGAGNANFIGEDGDIFNGSTGEREETS